VDQFFDKILCGYVIQSSRRYHEAKFNTVASCHLENKKKYHDISKNTCIDFSRILVCWCIMALLSQSGIKYTVNDNKTANINDKNCSLSTVLTATDQKLQKS